MKRDLPEKIADLASVYPDQESNHVGAIAEVVFALHFGLPVNKVRGFDGGKDFQVNCDRTRSGLLTIDVKGTAYCHRSSAGEIVGYFPYQKTWVTKADHIYVLLHVVEQEHLYFRGFAFGNDKICVQVYFRDEVKIYKETIAPKRPLAELETLLCRC